MTVPPYASTTVPFMQISGGEIEWANDRQGKLKMCEGDGTVTCAWPGQYRTDLFEVDKAAARIALGSSSDGYPPVGAKFAVVSHDGEVLVYTVTKVVQGGRPLSVSATASGGCEYGTSFGTAQSWRTWRSEATPA